MRSGAAALAKKVVARHNGDIEAVKQDPEYARYHDEEWGVPKTDDRDLFEKIVLEGFQAGLSWLTILKKRENFRAAFHQFDAERIARYTAKDHARLMADAGIVRNRLKIEATIANGRATAELHAHGETLRELLWRHAPAEPPAAADDLYSLPAQTPESKALSKELKKRGFRFVGPTTAYAAMQACGIVNDHLAQCPVRDDVEAERFGVEYFADDVRLVGIARPGDTDASGRGETRVNLVGDICALRLLDFCRQQGAKADRTCTEDGDDCPYDCGVPHDPDGASGGCECRSAAGARSGIGGAILRLLPI